MGLEQLFDKYGFWALLIFVLLDKGLPVLQKYLPFIGKQQEHKLEILREAEEKNMDMKEREVVALEQIGKALVLLSERIDGLEDDKRRLCLA